MANYKVEELPSPYSVLGEGPHWDAETQSLYYIDIISGSIHRYDYAENKTYNATIEGETMVAFIFPVERTTDQFAIGIERRLVIVTWDGKSPVAKVTRTVGKVDQEDLYKENRFNDAKPDPFGRFYGGTMRYDAPFDAPLGSLYKYSEEKGFENIRQKIGISNGLAWNLEKNKFYYIDSLDMDVKEFDYDPKTGNISNERVLINFRERNTSDDITKFLPDGMTIDSNGNLYVAIWGGSKILKVNPSTGKIDLEIDFPCDQVTSVAFGGPNLDILYATTAALTRDGTQTPVAGALFKVTGLGVRGTLQPKVKF